MLAIKVENLSKQYRLGEVGTGTSSHDLNRWWARIRGKEDPFAKIGTTNDRTQKADSDYVWALKDINFEINQGDAVGIIGRNGAGKSTLLKILSRTTLPTTGSVKVKGRIASLLEVGTGFHPEMTGRENIYQNGALLGMTKREITRKFDEIVDFSGCERYIDTPVKRYSSGMYVRLAFAVAAHLESEILIVDEVLAVGDAEFQKKCLGKMSDVSKGEGRTVLFVSHNMGAINRLCNSGICLKNGMFLYHGNTQAAISSYFSSGDNLVTFWESVNNNLYNPLFNPTRFALVNEKYEVLKSFVSANNKVGVLIEGFVEEENSLFTIGFSVSTLEGDLLFWSLSTDKQEKDWIRVKKGFNSFVGWIPSHLLNEGEYKIELMTSVHFQKWLIKPGDNSPVLSLEIRGELSDSPYWMQARPGLLGPILDFELSKI